MRNVDMVRSQREPFGRLNGPHGRSFAEQVGELAFMHQIQMRDQHEGLSGATRLSLYKPAERLQPARRCAEADYLSVASQ